ncbi:MAG: efflux RND transporter periplasmic adaptor subunit [Limnothrix sp. CACIAM 69d]|nr:MAG: efflux RND transporter periplasmic adaptor subunit [Limnothrix sp. CACIAM 69d]
MPVTRGDRQFGSQLIRRRWLSGLCGLALLASGCQNAIPPSDAQPAPPGAADRAGPPSVDVATAKNATQQTTQDYSGTTQPFREVAVRSRVEGYVLDMRSDVGQPVRQGQLLARVDARLLTSEAVEAQAEVSARELEVASSQAQIGEAQARVGEAELQLQQAKSDLDRLERLFREGAIAEQNVENARTAVGTAAKSLQAARQQVKTRQQTVAVARRRVAAQQAIADQARQRQDFALVRSPLSGLVLAKLLEPGSLAQPGSEIIRIGDFSQLKILVRLSDRALAGVRLGQGARVRLDALPGQEFTGRVTAISPLGDAVARQVPVEITIPNPDGRLGSGLLARVSFAQAAAARVTIPERALAVADLADRAPGGASGRGGRSAGAGQPAANAPAPTQGTVFVVQGEGEAVTVAPRLVQLGSRFDGQVQVLSGLQPGDRYVLRSSGPLAAGDRVRLSAISEPAR